MKKILFLICILAFALPAISADSSRMQYMNQSDSFAGFGKSLPKGSQTIPFAEPTTKVTAESEHDRYLDEFDRDGYRKTKPVSTEKKVIKTISDSKGKTTAQEKREYNPMTYGNFPRSVDDANNGMMMMPSIPALF